MALIKQRIEDQSIINGRRDAWAVKQAELDRKKTDAENALTEIPLSVNTVAELRERMNLVLAMLRNEK